MASVRMCGVVLWSSQADGRAVIWCEDHGKLAFYAAQLPPQAANGEQQGVSLDAGDLIEFDVEDQEHQRRAHNPRLLAADHAPCIAMKLQQQSPAAVQSRHCADAANAGHTTSAEIVRFTPLHAHVRVRAAG